MISGYVRLTDSGLKVDVNASAPSGTTHPGGRSSAPVFVIPPELYTLSGATGWPDEPADGGTDDRLVARVGRMRYYANASLPHRVQAAARLPREPVLVPQDAVSESRPRGDRAVRRARFVSVEDQRRRRQMAGAAAATVLSALLLIVSVARFATASREADHAGREYAEALDSLEQTNAVRAELANEQAIAESLALEVPLPGTRVLAAAVALAGPGDQIHQFQRRGTRFTLSGRFASPQELASGLDRQSGLAGVTVNTTRTESGTQSTITGRLGE